MKLQRMKRSPNPTLRHIIKKLRQGDAFYHPLCVEMPELAPS